MSDPRPAVPRTSGWVIGRVAGAPIILAPSWLLAAVVLTFLFAPTVRSWSPDLGGRVYVVAAVFVVLLFASVLVHELAHGLVARARGQQPREFVLTLWGGHTTFGVAAMKWRFVATRTLVLQPCGMMGTPRAWASAAILRHSVMPPERAISGWMPWTRP